MLNHYEARFPPPLSCRTDIVSTHPTGSCTKIRSLLASRRPALVKLPLSSAVYHPGLDKATPLAFILLHTAFLKLAEKKGGGIHLRRQHVLGQPTNEEERGMARK